MIFSKYTTKGRRSSNEDSVFVRIYNDSVLLAALAVSDGMGGMAAGEIASKSAIKKFEDIITGQIIKNQIDLLKIDIHKNSQKIINIINKYVFEKSKSDPELKGMGCTFTAAFVFPNLEYLVINVGDSRAYLINENFIKQITVDHNAKQEAIDKGEITEEQAKRYPFGNALTRCIGESDSPKVDVFSGGPLKKGDIILLTSDGLHSFIDREIIKYSLLCYENLDESLMKLANLALENNSDDNISLVAFSPELVVNKNNCSKLVKKIKGKNHSKNSRKTKSIIINVLIALLFSGLIANFYFIYKIAFTKNIDNVAENNNNNNNKPLTSEKKEDLIISQNNPDTLNVYRDDVKKFNGKVVLISPLNGQENVKFNPALFSWKLEGYDGDKEFRIIVKNAKQDKNLFDRILSADKIEFRLEEGSTYEWKVDFRIRGGEFITNNEWWKFTTSKKEDPQKNEIKANNKEKDTSKSKENKNNLEIDTNKINKSQEKMDTTSLNDKNKDKELHTDKVINKDSLNNNKEFLNKKGFNYKQNSDRTFETILQQYNNQSSLNFNEIIIKDNIRNNLDSLSNDTKVNNKEDSNSIEKKSIIAF